MKHILLTAPILLAAVFLLTQPALAVEYVVDGGNAAAADTNEGSAAAPFKTISKAADVSKPGDTIHVKAGLYREAVHLQHSGALGAPISFTADPPRSVVVTGADVITKWERVAGAASVYKTSWDHIFAIDWHNGKPIEFHPEDAPLWGRAEQVIADGKQLLPSASLQELQHAWADRSKAGAAAGSGVPSPIPHLGGPFVGMFAVDTAAKTLYVWLADSSDPRAHQMEASTRSQTFGVNQWEMQKGVSYIQVKGFVFRYGASFPQRAVVSLHGDHNLLENSVVESMAGAGAAVGGTMRECIVRNCGQVGGAAGGDGFLNEDCLWEGNCWKPIDRGWDAGGVKMALVHGGVFRRCVFRRNGGPGLWFDIDCRGIDIHDCVFQENEGSGLFIEISRDFSVTHNLAVGNGTGVVGPPGPSGWSNGGLQLGESENCIVAYNTCVGNKDGITFREQGPRPISTHDWGEIPYHDTGDVIVGNVCAYNLGYQLGLWYDNAFFGWHPAEKEKYKTEAAYETYLKTIPDKIYDPTHQGQVIDHNLYYAAPGQSLILYGVEWRPKHQVFNTLVDFTAHTGFDAHSLVADPAFVGRAAANYQFAPTSPALATGTGWRAAPASTGEWINSLLPGGQ